MTKPVADYTPCEGCMHPKALHSDRGCHVIIENRAAKHQPNVTCGCGATANSESKVAQQWKAEAVRDVELPEPPTGAAIATAVHDAVKKVHEDARTYQPPAPPRPRDEKSFLVEKQQQWVSEQRQLRAAWARRR